jgi:hypothetical protein
MDIIPYNKSLIVAFDPQRLLFPILGCAIRAKRHLIEELMFFFGFCYFFTHTKKTSALFGLLDEAPKASDRISWLCSRVNGFFTAALPKGKGITI